MYDIITLGSATVDIFVKTAPKQTKVEKHQQHHDVCYHVGEKVLVDDVHTETGGGGTNTAVAFSRLGFKTGWIGKLGDDANTSIIEQMLKNERVAMLGKKGKGKAGFSVIIVGLEHDRTILSFKGINDQLAVKDIQWPQCKAKWLYVSSMLGTSLKTAFEAVQRARKAGMRWAFNPSMYLAEQGVSKLSRLVDGCDLLILNKEEAAALLSSNGDVDYLLRKLQERAKLVCITDGPRGAYLYNGIKKYSLTPPHVEVVETTGAGDAFASGLVAGIMLELPIEDALRLGAAQAASVVQHIGAKNVLLDRASALKAMKGIRVSASPL